jgi:hypothetical protein
VFWPFVHYYHSIPGFSDFRSNSDYSLYNINPLLFITETLFVYCAVRNESVNIFEVNSDQDTTTDMTRPDDRVHIWRRRWLQHSGSLLDCLKCGNMLRYLMFCWPCIILYQYNETNVRHLSFNLLRIKDLYMFRALLAHPQEAIHKRHLVYCVRMSVGCGTVAVSLQPCHSRAVKLQTCHSPLTLYARSIPNPVCVTPPEDEQVMLETCGGPWFSINWMKGASRWFHYTVVLRYCPPVTSQ